MPPVQLDADLPLEARESQRAPTRLAREHELHAVRAEAAGAVVEQDDVGPCHDMQSRDGLERKRMTVPMAKCVRDQGRPPNRLASCSPPSVPPPSSASRRTRSPSKWTARRVCRTSPSSA